MLINYLEIVLIFYSTVSVIEWDRFTSDIITEADKTLVNGRPIRAFFDKCLNKMIEDLKAQSDAVNQAIRLRVDEYMEVIEKLNKQKAEVCVSSSIRNIIYVKSNLR